MAPLPRRAFIAVTSASAKLFDGKETTGAFISEALHPFQVFTAAGFEVDLASETGKYTPDWLSLQPDFLAGEDLATYQDTASAFRRKLDNMPRAADIDPDAYGVFFASAGHAALLDFPTATDLQRIAESVWARGGIVSSVCHGPAVFAHVVDRATGEPLIKGKTITGFTSEAEVVMKVDAEMKTWNRPLVEEHAATLGATCKRTPSGGRPCANAEPRQARQGHLGQLPHRRRTPHHRPEPPERQVDGRGCCRGLRQALVSSSGLWEQGPRPGRRPSPGANLVICFRMTYSRRRG